MSKKRKTHHVASTSLDPLAPRPGIWQLRGGDTQYGSTIQGDYYQAFKNPGSIVIDRTDILGSDGTNRQILLAALPVYAGFASPSNWSVAQASSALMVYHDISTERFQSFIDQLAMSAAVKGKKSYAPHTHACLDIEVLEPTGSPDETAESFETAIRDVIARAVNKFVRLYQETLKLPAGGPPAEIRPSLEAFLSWMSEMKIDVKVFATVRHLQRLFGRFLDAAMWEEYCDRASAPTLIARLDAIRRLVLIPLWRRLGMGQNGIVRKLLVTGPFLIDYLLEVPNDVMTPGIQFPGFRDLSVNDSLHGITQFDIEWAFALVGTDKKVLRQVLDRCNRFSASRSDPAGKKTIYAQESVSAVCSTLKNFEVQPQLLDTLPPKTADRLCETYAEEQRDQVLQRLYPVLCRDSELADLADGLLNTSNPVTLDQGFGPGKFSLEHLVSAPTHVAKASRFFLSGLLAKVEDGSETYYTLAGGCARAVLQAAVDEAKKIRPKIAVDVDAISLDDVRIPEEELARVILEYFRNVPPDKQPKDEAEFQAHFAEILRAVVERHLRHLGFSSDVQIEVWLKKVKDDSTVAHLRFDVAIRIRSKKPGGADRLYIFELKYFSLDNTMEATHANLKRLHPGEQVLDSQISGSSDVFWQELCSIRPSVAQPANLAGWSVQAGTDTPPRKLRFEFSPQHIHCYYYVDPTETNAEASQPAPKASQPAPKAPQPAAKAPQHAPKASQPRRAAKEPKADKIQKLKKAVEVVRDAADQAREYMEVAAQGVGDELGPWGRGFADARITDLGQGETTIIAYSIVNIAGALVNVKCLGAPETLHRKVAIVGAYPWTPDPTKKKVDALRDKKKKLSQV